MASMVVSNDSFVVLARGMREPGLRVVAAPNRAGHLDTSSSGSGSVEPAPAPYHLPPTGVPHTAAASSAAAPHAVAASSAAAPHAAAASSAAAPHAAAASSAAASCAATIRSSPIGVFVDHVHIVVVVVWWLVVVRKVLCLRSRQFLAPQHDEEVHRKIVLLLGLVVPVHDTGEGS
eukprot:8670065-Pyramimonas_sp.AAC.1